MNSWVRFPSAFDVRLFSETALNLELCSVNGNRVAPYFIILNNAIDKTIVKIQLSTSLLNPLENEGVMISCIKLFFSYFQITKCRHESFVR